MGDLSQHELRDLETFVAGLGTAMTALGQPVHKVQQRLQAVANGYGARDARISAFPTYFMVTMGSGAPATLAITTPLAPLLRLDQVAALDQLVTIAEHAEVTPPEGLAQLDRIRRLQPRYGKVVSLVGYALLTLGLCLILHPAARDVLAAAAFGVLVGILQLLASRRPAFQVLLPIAAAFVVSTLTAVASEHGVTGPGLPAMIAALVVFLPGATLTNAVLELAAGQMVSGSSRLVAGAVQLALLAFGILAGIELAGVPSAQVLQTSPDKFGSWAPSLGVAVFALGVHFAHSAPPRSLPALVVVLYAAWTTQVLVEKVSGAYLSAFVAAIVLTVVAAAVSHLPRSMPADAAFLPGFWLLVPGALGLSGLARLAGNFQSAGIDDLIATTVTIFAIAVGVLCGAIVLEGGAVGRRAAGSISRSATRRPRRWMRRRRRNTKRGDGIQG
jgi:uncharacterized membrane protein YjjP (DUF1212 family)